MVVQLKKGVTSVLHTQSDLCRQLVDFKLRIAKQPILRLFDKQPRHRCSRL